MEAFTIVVSDKALLQSRQPGIRQRMEDLNPRLEARGQSQEEGLGQLHAGVNLFF